VQRAVLVGEGERVLGGKHIAVGLGVVCDIAAGSLAAQPLTGVALSDACAFGDLS
jgi:hypothetical protein